jgi:hypothetical protein
VVRPRGLQPRPIGSSQKPTRFHELSIVQHCVLLPVIKEFRAFLAAKLAILAMLLCGEWAQ